MRGRLLGADYRALRISQNLSRRCFLQHRQALTMEAVNHLADGLAIVQQCRRAPYVPS